MLDAVVTGISAVPAVLTPRGGGAASGPAAEAVEAPNASVSEPTSLVTAQPPSGDEPELTETTVAPATAEDQPPVGPASVVMEDQHPVPAADVPMEGAAQPTRGAPTMMAEFLGVPEAAEDTGISASAASGTPVSTTKPRPVA